MTVVDLQKVRNAQRAAAMIEKAFGSEIRRARAHGFKLMTRIEAEEQIGRGEIYVARVRLLPQTDSATDKLRAIPPNAAGERMIAIEGRADYLEPGEAADAIKTAIDEAFTFALDNGVF